MSLIDELVEAAAAATGLGPDRTRLGIGGALALIEKHGDPAKVARLLDEVPGAAALAAAGQALVQTKGGGLMGGLMRGVGGAGGAAMSDAMALGKTLERQGVRASDLKTMLPVAMDFVRERTGRDLLRDVLASIPGVGKLLTGE